MSETEDRPGTTILVDSATQRHPLELVRQGKLLESGLVFGESTLAMLKSHIFQAGGSVIGQILYRIMTNEMEIAALMPAYLSPGMIRELYAEHVANPYFDTLVESVNHGVIVMALRGPRVVQRWRDMLGATNSMVAKEGTLRARYGSRTVVANNVAHGSDSLQAARRELALFFPQHIQLWAGT